MKKFLSGFACVFAFAAVICSQAQAGDPRELSGTYLRVNGTEVYTLGVLYDHMDALDIMIDSTEFRAVRQPGSDGAFAYFDDKCIIVVTPFIKDKKQALHMETMPGTACAGKEGKALPLYNENLLMKSP